MATLLCIGEILVEMVAADVDQPISEPGRWAGPFPSGAPAILADQAALCGVEVSLVGTVGADAFGEACLARLRSSGVVVDRVRVDANGTTGVAFVRYRGDGSRSFVFHLAESASGRFRLSDPRSGLLGVDGVHLMGSSLFSSAAVKAVEEVFDAARAQGIPVSFDPNIRPEMLRREYVPTLQRIVRGAQVVLASEGELQPLLGEVPDEDCARQLLAGSATMVVLKRGARGAGLYLPGHDPISVAGISVNEVDPTGAGDCFGGTFLSLVMQGWDPQEALRYANLAGALAVTQRGPMSGNRSLRNLRAAEQSFSST